MPRKKAASKQRNVTKFSASNASSSKVASSSHELLDNRPLIVGDDSTLSDSVGIFVTKNGNSNATQAFQSPMKLEDSPLSTLSTSVPVPAPISTAAEHSDHHLLIRPNVDDKQHPCSFPESYTDRWDNDHVRMPCSLENFLLEPDGEKTYIWDVITETLRHKPIESSKDLEDAILSYNGSLVGTWNFDCLHSFFREYLPADEVVDFFSQLLPDMIHLALSLPQIVTQPPPLLKSGVSKSVTMSQQQIACLLANAFLCTIPRHSGRDSYPSINFATLFGKPTNASRGSKDVKQRCKHEKLRAFLHYFRRVCRNSASSLENSGCGCVTFSRRVLNEPFVPDWSNSKEQFNKIKLHCTATGGIEDVGLGMLQVDFANRKVGGGVLGNGCVQEEIRFVICPELMVARLFTETLSEREALIVQGVERFSRHSGYGDTFVWDGDFHEITDGGNSRDSWGRWRTWITAVNALVFRSYLPQFSSQKLIRELNKAYCGFADFTQDLLCPLPKSVATGNWGCGAYGGDRRLKALLQMIVCVECDKDLCYCTFGETAVRNAIVHMHMVLKETGATVGEVWHLMQEYAQLGENASLSEVESTDVYAFLERRLLERRAPASNIDEQPLEMESPTNLSHEKATDSPECVALDENCHTPRNIDLREHNLP